MDPAKGLLQLNFYQNIHVRLERWKDQTRYYCEEVVRIAFSSPSFMKLLTPAYPAFGRDRGRQADITLGQGTLPVKDWAT